jgi:muramoyltetrapeptide carboxypeptidase LdcA involved in peptidoglycan recycling
MADYILFMHDDAEADDPSAWDAYLQTLKQKGVFEGGSAIGGGICMRKDTAPREIAKHLVGYIRVAAATMDEVKSLLSGNPHFEQGGTVEIRELPQT